MKPNDLFEHLCSVSTEADPLPCLPEHGAGSSLSARQNPIGRIPNHLLHCLADDSPRPFEALPEELRYIRHPWHGYPVPWESGASL